MTPILLWRGHLLNTYAPWFDYEKQAALVGHSFTQEDTTSQQMIEMVRGAEQQGVVAEVVDLAGRTLGVVVDARQSCH